MKHTNKQDVPERAHADAQARPLLASQSGDNPGHAHADTPAAPLIASQSEDGLPALLRLDPWLAPYEKDLRLRIQHFAETKTALVGKKGTLSDFANGHHYFGFHRTKTGWVYREWAPAADALFLLGDFNIWDRSEERRVGK